MSGFSTALRYEKLPLPSAPFADPYLAIYPLRDITFPNSAEFARAIDSCESEDLPGKSVFKTVEMVITWYEYVDEQGGREGELRSRSEIEVGGISIESGTEKGRSGGAVRQEEQQQFVETIAVLEYIPPTALMSDEALVSYIYNIYVPLLKARLTTDYIRTRLYRFVDVFWAKDVEEERRRRGWLVVHEFKDEIDDGKTIGENEEAWKELEEDLARKVGGKVERVGFKLTEKFGDGTWIG